MDTTYKLEKNLFNCCNNYIDKCNNNEIQNPREVIYNACFNYLNGNSTNKIINLLSQYFDIYNTPTF